ncbi:hypothetical protein, partial [Burkholderia cepacia]|uniref:hypothetical protein n=1 Tax=Burkholderia cepacia TaxID=292 RepID=UPI003F510E32
YVRWGWARFPAFDMADWLRQSKRAHHALEKLASENGRPESLTVEPPRQPLHVIRCQGIGTDNDRQRIARKRPGAEDIDHMDRKSHDIALSIQIGS